MSKPLNKNTSSYLWLRSGVFYFIRRVPADIRRRYKADRVSLSLRRIDPRDHPVGAVD